MIATKKLVPASLRRARTRLLRISGTLKEVLPAYVYDGVRYLRYSSSLGPWRTEENLRSMITASYHNIEKGLSLPDPRPGFGAEQVSRLVRLTRAYADQHGWRSWLAVPVSVLRAYLEFNAGHGVTGPHEGNVAKLVVDAEAHFGAVPAGVKQVHRTSIRSLPLDFFTTRSSVRQYAEEVVDPADIEFAARAAQAAPAVCNRQYSRIYVYTDPKQIADILEVQGGARGFGDQLGGLAVITTDLRNFWGAAERNQAWIDGGLFAMNFMLGLHARGLGSVPLNWSKTPTVDRQLRGVIDLPEEAVIIMLIGFGVLRDTYTVANSARVPLDEVLAINP